MLLMLKCLVIVIGGRLCGRHDDNFIAIRGKRYGRHDDGGMVIVVNGLKQNRSWLKAFNSSCAFGPFRKVCQPYS